jgi:hypothetical protein
MTVRVNIFMVLINTMIVEVNTDAVLVQNDRHPAENAWLKDGKRDENAGFPVHGTRPSVARICATRWANEEGGGAC